MDSHHGYLPRDKAGWYRKTFALPAGWSGGGASWLHFEGVFQAVDVFVNGKFVLRHTSGYLGFDVPLDPAPGGEALLRPGGQSNVIALRVDASFGSGHWCEKPFVICDKCTPKLKIELADDGRAAPAPTLPGDCCGLPSPTRSPDGSKRPETDYFECYFGIQKHQVRTQREHTAED